MASPQPQHIQQQQQGYPLPSSLENTYQQPQNNGDYIQPVQHQDTGNGQQYQHQPLPPSYDQAKAAPPGQPLPAVDGQAPATVIPLNMLGNEPQWIDCPFCRQRTKTMINKEGDSMQIVVGALLCFVCICLTCLPCILGWFENVEYRCSQCKNMVAIRRQDAPLEVFGPQIPVYSQYSAQQQPMDYNQQQPHDQQTKGVQSPGVQSPGVQSTGFQSPAPQDQQQYHQQQYEQHQQQQQYDYMQQQPTGQQYQQHEMQNMQPQQPSPAAQPYGQNFKRSG